MQISRNILFWVIFVFLVPSAASVYASAPCLYIGIKFAIFRQNDILERQQHSQVSGNSLHSSPNMAVASTGPL